MPSFEANAGSVKIVIEGDGSGFSASVADAQRQLEKLGGKSGAAGREMRKSMEDARGSVMVLGEEIGIHLPRHVQKALAEIPALAKVLAAAFAPVAVIAVGAAIADATEKVKKFFKDMKEGTDKVHDGFESMRLSAQTSNDELRKSNNELANQIAKLEGRPQNNLAIALDDARIESDKLQTSLEKSYQDVKKLLEENRAGFWEQVFGKGSTSDVRDQVEGAWKQMREVQRKITDAVHGGATGAAAALQIQLRQVQDKALQDLNEQIKMRTGTVLRPVGGGIEGPSTYDALQARPYADVYGDQSKNLDALKGARDLIYQMQDAATLDATHSALAGKAGGLQGARDLAATQMQRWQQELAAQQADHTVTLDDEAAFWQKRADSVAKGSDLYNRALMQANRLMAEAQTQRIATFVSESIREAEDRKQQGDSVTEAIDEAGVKQIQAQRDMDKKAYDSALKGFEDQARLLEDKQKLQEEIVKAQQASGRLSAHEAALAIQSIHESGFGQWSQISAAFSAQRAGSGVPGAAQVVNDYEAQSQKDSAAVEATSALGGLRRAAQDLSQRFTDLGPQIGKVLNEAISSVNDAVLRTLTDPYHRGDWRQAGKSVTTSVARTGLEYVEGSALKGLFGKNPMAKMGSRSNPIWTRSADVVSATGSSGLLSGILGGAPGSGIAGSSKTVGAGSSGLLGALNKSSFFGNLFGGRVFGPGGVLDSGSSVAHASTPLIAQALGMLPGFAAGGDVSAGQMVMVGERGPEPFIPARAGRILPNSALGGNVTHHHHWNIDARGATDPAAVEAAIRRATPKIVAHSVGASLQAHVDHNSRVPKSRRI